MSFFLLSTYAIADYTSSVDFNKNTINYSLQGDYSSSSDFVQASSFNDAHEVNSKSINSNGTFISYVAERVPPAIDTIVVNKLKLSSLNALTLTFNPSTGATVGKNILPVIVLIMSFGTYSKLNEYVAV